ncbi:MAG: putative sugar nucleotidyl transferase [Bacteroidota bacterium]
MKLCLFDGRAHEDLLPLTFTRPVSDLRVGIYTIKEKWEKLWNTEVIINASSYLSTEHDNEESDELIFVSSSVFPSRKLIENLSELRRGQKIVREDRTIAFCSTWEEYNECKIETFDAVKFHDELSLLRNPGNLFEFCDDQINYDIALSGMQSRDSWEGNTVIGDRLFIEEGAKAKACIFNTDTGPIYIGKNAEVLEGTVIRGPFVLGEGAVVKMAAKIYGPTSIGPYCKVGGELSNVVMLGYSNKGHDGFLGNSVIGEWCNLGADTNTSNLKNNYGEVKVWDYKIKDYVPSGRQFQGLIMGDHSKTSINTMLNTGTTVGVCANIFEAGFPPKFVPSFSWGANEEFKLEKAFEVAERMMMRRKIDFTDLDKEILSHIFNQTREFRT